MVELSKDIYFQKRYASLYENEYHQIFPFHYNKGDKQFFNFAIKRPIHYIGAEKVKDNYFDLETPYGYGGYFANTSDQHFINEAFEEYHQLCRCENIIAEFIRFHPFFHSDVFKSMLSFYTIDSQVVYIPLNQSTEDRWKGYSNTTRNVLRKCYKVLIVRESDDIDKFASMYYKTMEKNEARDFYFFNEDYFRSLLALDGARLFEVLHEGTVISMGIFLFSDDFVHYHLSANEPEYYKLNGNYILLDHLAEVATQEGKDYFMLGGGRTSEEDDGLLRFKGKFSKSRKNFNIGGNVISQEKYQEFIDKWKQQASEIQQKVPFFLKYRLPLYD